MLVWRGGLAVRNQDRDQVHLLPSRQELAQVGLGEEVHDLARLLGHVRLKFARGQAAGAKRPVLQRVDVEDKQAARANEPPGLNRRPFAAGVNYWVIRTRVPSGRPDSTCSASAGTRTQPLLTEWPNTDGFGQPCRPTVPGPPPKVESTLE